MIELITDIIHQTRPATETWTSVEIAQQVLFTLERKGMLPSEIINYTESNNVEINSWEPEDDDNDADKYCGAV